MHSVTLKTTYRDSEGTFVSKEQTITGDMRINIAREGIAAGYSDLAWGVPVTVANILAFCMGITRTPGGSNAKSTGKTVLGTVETNSTSAPDETFNLTETNGLSWSLGDPTSNPLETNITTIYFSNTGTAQCDFFLHMLIDMEPEVSSSSSSVNSSSSSSSTSSSTQSSGSSSSSSASSVSSSSSTSSNSSSSLSASSLSTSSSASSASSSSSSSSSSTSQSASSASSSSSSSKSISSESSRSESSASGA